MDLVVPAACGQKRARSEEPERSQTARTTARRQLQGRLGLGRKKRQADAVK